MRHTYKVFVAFFIMLQCALFADAQTISFSDNGDTLIINNSAYYELGILKSNGAITHVIEKPSGDKILLGSLDDNLWSIGFDDETKLGSSDFTGTYAYNWDNANKKLVISYSNPNTLSVVVTITASPDRYFDLQLSFTNYSDKIINSVSFPHTLKFDETKIKNGLFPDKPGLMLSADYFAKLSSCPDGISGVHPPAIADYLGLQTANTTLALYSEWGSGSVQISSFGFKHLQGTTAGMSHGFNVWRPKGYSWTSSPVRIRFANSFEETIQAYRTENLIDKYESLKDKLGAKYTPIINSPYIDFAAGWFGPYTSWHEIFKTFTAPAILYISSFYPGGFHGHFPDVIPPDPNFGTTEEFKAALDSAHAYDLMTMPMILPHWWHENSPTVLNLESQGLTIDSIAELDKNGDPSYYFWELAGIKDYGYGVSPRVPFVQNRLTQLMNTLSNDIGFDLIYEDVIGAGNASNPDYNSYAPDTLDTEGWLDHTRTFKDHLLITETGSDIFAETEVGFLGGGHTPTWDEFPNTKAWPMSSFLLKDKVLRYHYWGGAGTINKSALGWNLAFGYMLNISYDPSTGNGYPETGWFKVINKFQTKIISRYADQLLNSYTEFSSGNAMQCVYDSMLIVANRDTLQNFAYGNHVLSPAGVLAYTPDEKTVAGIFSTFNNKELVGEDQFLLIQEHTDSIEVTHPRGISTPLTLKMIPTWDKDDTLWAKAYYKDGMFIDALEVTNDSTTCSFSCLTRVQGRIVDHYQIVKAENRPESSWKIYCNKEVFGNFILGNKHYYEIHVADYSTALIYIIDKTSGDTISTGSEWGRLWGVEFLDAPSGLQFLDPISSSTPDHTFHLERDWSLADSTLTFHYSSDSIVGIEATVTIAISTQNYFDIQMSMVNNWGYTAHGISFPHHLVFETDTTTTALLPFDYPGMRLKSSFFTNHKQYESIYPSRFKSDFFSYQKQDGNMSIYSLWEDDPVRNTQMGLLYNLSGFYYYRHKYIVALDNGDSWISPKLRIRIGQSPVEIMKEYRSDNNLNDPTTSLRNRLDPTIYKQIVKSPLFFNSFGESTDLPFNEFANWATQLPSPSILMLSSYYPDGQYGSHPDVLPPNGDLGSENEFKTMIGDLHAQDKLVMPYTIPVWWNESSPTILNLPGSTSINDISIKQADGTPAYTSFNGIDFGYLVSAENDFVKQRIAQNYSELKGTYKSDIIFEDFISSPYINVDFNSSYHDEWLDHAKLYRDSLLMINSGYDRLIPNATGNISTIYFDQELGVSPVDYDFGDENWEYYPIAPLAYHDKIIPFQSADYSTTNKDILSWNMLFGCSLSFTPDKNDPNMSASSPWIDVISLFQSKAISKIIGKQMTDYSKLSADVLISEFEDIQVIRNASLLSGYNYDKHSIAPQGALLSSFDGNLTAGIFNSYNNVALSAGDHYLIIQKTNSEIYLYHPMGTETEISLERPSKWTDSNLIKTEAFTATGSILLPKTTTSNTVKFNLPRLISENTVSYFKVSYANFYNDTIISICLGDSLFWRNNYFTESGSYYDSLLTVSGHDSIYSLLLSNFAQVPLSLGNDTTLNTNETLTLDPGDWYESYIWSDGSTQQELVFDASLVDEGNSTLWLNVTDNNDCFQSDTITITISGEANLLFYEQEDFNIKIYPNPTSGKLTINTRELNDVVLIEFYTGVGRKLKESLIDPQTSIDLDISYFKKGVYFLRIYYKHQKYNYKLIVN